MSNVTYGTGYYALVAGAVSRVSGLAVKLIKTGHSWGAADGVNVIDLTEVGTTGYYKNESVPEGYYELWSDEGDVGNPGTNTGRRIQVGQILSDGLSNGSVVAEKIADDAITEAKIQAGAVTENKINDDAISTNKLQNGAVIENKVSDVMKTKLDMIKNTLAVTPNILSADDDKNAFDGGEIVTDIGTGKHIKLESTTGQSAIIQMQVPAEIESKNPTYEIKYLGSGIRGNYIEFSLCYVGTPGETSNRFEAIYSNGDLKVGGSTAKVSFFPEESLTVYSVLRLEWLSKRSLKFSSYIIDADGNEVPYATYTHLFATDITRAFKINVYQSSLYIKSAGYGLNIRDLPILKEHIEEITEPIFNPKILSNTNEISKVNPTYDEASSSHNPLLTSDGLTEITGKTGYGYHGYVGNADPEVYVSGFNTDISISIPADNNNFAFLGAIGIIYKYSRNGTQYPFNNMYFTTGSNQHYFGSSGRGLLRKGGGDAEENLVSDFFPDVNIDSGYILFLIEWISADSYILSTFIIDDTTGEWTLYKTYTFTETNIATATGKQIVLRGYQANVYVKQVLTLTHSTLAYLKYKTKQGFQSTIDSLQNSIEKIESNPTDLRGSFDDAGLDCKLERVTKFDAFKRRNFHDFKGQVDNQTRVLAWGFDDGRQTDFDWVAPMFSKYFGRASFNIIYNSLWSDDFVKSVQELISMGHEIGDHTFFHKTYMYNSPLFNGYDDTNPDGSGQASFPSFADFTADVGGGYNAFGYALTSDCPYKTGTNWGALTLTDCNVIRNAYSIVAQSSYMEMLDDLSNTYCGTTGHLADGWDANYYGTGVGAYSGGIFQGCKTTENHEIWERLQECKIAVMKYVLGVNDPIREWSMPGGQQETMDFPTTIPRAGVLYYDRSKQVEKNDFGQFLSTRLNEARSWSEVLRKYGYQNVHDSFYTGRQDGHTQIAMNYGHILNAHLSHPDALNYITLLSRVNSNYTTPSNIYSETTFNGVTDRMKWLYENDAEFKAVIDKISNYTAQGIIPYGATDSGDSYTWKLFYEMYIRFCYLAGIKLITKAERTDIAYKHEISVGNLFCNPNFDRTVARVIEASNAPVQPDGWTAGAVITADTDGNVPDSTSNVLHCDTTSIEFRNWLIQIGRLRFSCYGKIASGSGTIEIYKIKNSDVYNASGTLIGTITVNGSSWTKYSADFNIKDETLIKTGLQSCQGYDNKICALRFVISGSGLKITMPYLKKLNSNEI